MYGFNLWDLEMNWRQYIRARQLCLSLDEDSNINPFRCFYIKGYCHIWVRFRLPADFKCCIRLISLRLTGCCTQPPSHAIYDLKIVPDKPPTSIFFKFLASRTITVSFPGHKFKHLLIFPALLSNSEFVLD